METATGAASGARTPQTSAPQRVHSAAVRLAPAAAFLGQPLLSGTWKDPGLWVCLMFSPGDIDILHVWQEEYPTSLVAQRIKRLPATQETRSGMPLDILHPQETQLKGALL